MLGMKMMERMGMSQATTATARRLANPSVQRLANARYEDDGEDGYEPGNNSIGQRLANPSVQRQANYRYEDDGKDGYEPGYNRHCPAASQSICSAASQCLVGCWVGARLKGQQTLPMTADSQSICSAASQCSERR